MGIPHKNQENRGAAYSFQKAIENCHGDMIMFCDQDDIWLNTKVEKFESAFKKNSKASFIISDAQIINSNGVFLDYTLWKQRKFTKKWQKKFEKKLQFKVFFKRNVFTGMTTAIKSNLVSFKQPNKDPILHDAWYIPVSLLVGQHGILINKPLTLYRQHENQLFGAKKINIYNKPTYIRKTHLTSLKKQIKTLKRLYEYTKSLNNENIILLKRKINHLESRLVIVNTGKFKRVNKVIWELFNGNYNNFSSITLSQGLHNTIHYEFIEKQKDGITFVSE
ncbi:MAG TPA: glycosyltransferase [Prolixibacteraceae bacterium]|nr:glycosyltransferase [Prolixibacteraceae bacterium]